jgi:PAS domain S-box-containing protein
VKPDQFQLMAAVMPEPLLLLTSTGIILAHNPAAAEQLGLTGQIAGTSLADIVTEPPDEVAHYLRTCSRSRTMALGALTVRKANRACRAEGALLRERREAEEPLLILRLVPKASAIGRFVALNQRVDALAREIQLRKASERAARDSAERLKVTLASIGDAVIVTDAAGQVVSLNAVAESLTEWIESDAVGLDLDVVFNIVNEETRLPVENPALRAIREGAIVGLANHTILIGRHGSEVPIDDSAAPIRDGTHQIGGAVLVFRDISKRKQAEAESREADRRKDEFLAMLAHELRNPLAPLRNGLKVLALADARTPQHEQTLGMMERQLLHLVRLVDDLLDVNRISRGTIDLQKKTVDLASIVAAALETCGPAIERSSQTLTVSASREALFVDADSHRLAQALCNLIGNASKFSKSGAEIRVHIERQKDQAVVRVEDEGIGMPEALLPSIFEIFFQGDSSLNKTHGGLGIGLYVVQQLVSLHKGSVAVRSAGPGEGSEFSVSLPMVPAPEVTPGTSADASPKTMSRRILIADDNIDSATSLSFLLQMAGNETRLASDGLEALQTAGEYLPDVAVLDIGMPGLNGYEVCQRIRDQPWGRSIVLIALTGWGQSEDKRRATESGFDAHFVKPINLRALEDYLAGLPMRE